MNSPLADIARLGLEFEQPHQVVQHFEQLVARHFGAQHGVATDCCTHALELVLRAREIRAPLKVPRHTYMSVPMMLDKIGIDYELVWHEWRDSYELAPGIRDAATVWQPSAHVPGEITCISFQFKKHINIGRGGMILLDDRDLAQRLRRMRHDGRSPDIDQFHDDVTELGYHYYMTPEDAARGILLYHDRGHEQYQAWHWQRYRDLLEFDYFRKKKHAES